ncbi:Pol protein [Phytophthora palmivora]|uniref:Pol protein n=1 Tax=Phytophthora palmivora TaxID=4796 RepID=A0A2P4XTV7_9STRA|nr:Pol protein [Phytophthora palmivora]
MSWRGSRSSGQRVWVLRSSQSGGSSVSSGEEFSDVVSMHPPSQLPRDRGVRHEIDLVPGTKYCVTRQFLYFASNAFFAEKAKSGMVRESKSPHSTPIFRVRKPNRK